MITHLKHSIYTLLRWIFFIPVAFLVQSIVFYIVQWMMANFLGAEGYISAAIVYFFAMLAGGFAFMFIGNSVAPVKQHSVIKILSAVGVAAGIAGICFCIYNSNYLGIIMPAGFLFGIVAGYLTIEQQSK